jgi:hypothetical protein
MKKARGKMKNGKLKEEGVLDRIYRIYRRGKGGALRARVLMESPVLSRHGPRRRGIVPAEAGSAAIEFWILNAECWMLDVGC